MADDLRAVAIDLRALLARMDDCLIAIEDGRPVPQASLRALPPWRAVLVARVAAKAGAIADDELARLVAEARRVGGAGRLEPGPAG